MRELTVFLEAAHSDGVLSNHVAVRVDVGKDILIVIREPSLSEQIITGHGNLRSKQININMLSTETTFTNVGCSSRRYL